ncbi:restriction endonuclease subunit S [uncultured Prevotella sp.]|uniref:restriction endonuclease subunit S n=1 Tax=uncultured Prevotella sp. TaxID=159272 RepID=UPI0027E3676D|nr:restriction endonuclease subunit S [uncultured Prevotella sp.]
MDSAEREGLRPKGNVPNLRFPEFQGEWEEHYLSDYLDFKNGLNPKPDKFGRGIKFISVMDILNNTVITNDCIRVSVDVSEEELHNFCVENGDMLFQRSSETLEDVGRANVYMDDKPAVFGGFVIRGKKKAEYNPLFFRYLLASPFARRKIIPMGAGAQHFNIGQEGLNRVKLHFASLDEQKKIATFLSLLDERIATQNKIIDKLQSLIKGIRNDVLEKLRKNIGFNAVVGDVLDYEQPQSYIVEDTEYTNEGTPVLTANKAFVLGYTLETDGIYDKGDCIIFDDFTLDCKYVDFPFKVKSSAIKILTAKNKELLRYAFEFLKYLDLSTEEHKRHYIAETQNQEFIMPTEQMVKTIAHIFSTLSLRMETAVKQRDVFEKQKQYLLRQMFI